MFLFFRQSPQRLSSENSGGKLSTGPFNYHVINYCHVTNIYSMVKFSFISKGVLVFLLRMRYYTHCHAPPYSPYLCLTGQCVTHSLYMYYHGFNFWKHIYDVASVNIPYQFCIDMMWHTVCFIIEIHCVWDTVYTRKRFWEC